MTAVLVWSLVGYIGAVCLLALLAGSFDGPGGVGCDRIEEAKKLDEETEEFVALPTWWW